MLRSGFKSAFLQHRSHAAVKKNKLVIVQKLIKAFFFSQFVHLLPLFRNSHRSLIEHTAHPLRFFSIGSADSPMTAVTDFLGIIIKLSFTFSPIVRPAFTTSTNFF